MLNVHRPERREKSAPLYDFVMMMVMTYNGVFSSGVSCHIREHTTTHHAYARCCTVVRNTLHVRVTASFAWSFSLKRSSPASTKGSI